MKTKLRRISKRSISILLSLIMMLSIIAVGTVSAGAYTSMNGKIYFDNSKTNWTNVYLYVGHGSYAKSYSLTNTGSNNIWSMTFSDSFTDRTKLYFANHNDSPNGQSYGIDTQYGWNTNNSTRTALTTANNNDANSLFTPSSASAGTLTRSYPRVVAGDIASNGWDNKADLMTYSSSTYTKTYSNVSVGDYSFAVVGFDDWNTSYRWAAKGTLTANGAGSWADANDGDHNIKLTLTSKASVKITLNSSNKVNVTLTPSSHTASVTSQPSNGSLYVGTSSSSVSSTSISVAEGSTYYIKATPSTGYKLATLKVGSTSVIGNNTGATSAVTVSRTMGTADETVTATFTKITYSVTYNKGSVPGSSGSISGTVPSTQTKTYGVDLTLATNAFTYTGYTQKGWATSDGGAQAYASGATYTGNAALSLYPYWEANTYTITYKDGGNTAFSGTHASGYPTSYTYGVGATLKSATKDNYIFGGWFDNSSCTGTAVTSISTTATGNKTYYAKWTLSATPQLASISDVSKTVNDTTFNVSATINNSNYASGTLSVTASSGTTSVATVGTVSKSGDNVTIPLTVKGPGTSTITVTLKDGSTTVDTKTFTVTVAEPTLTLTNKTIYTSTKNSAITVTQSPTPSSKSWSSNNTTYITVNSSGQVTAVKTPTSDQTATITATATYACGYTKSATCNVTLKAPAVTISSTKTSGYINDTATASVSSSSNPTVDTTNVSAYNWTSSDSTVVSVSSATAASPTLTFLKNGTATISLEVTYKNTSLKKTSNSLSITVNAPTVSMSNQTVAKGDSVTFSATTTNPTGLTIAYSLKSAVSGVSINSSTGVVTVTSGCTATSATVVATAKNSAGTAVATKEATLTIQAPSLTIADIANNSTQYATVGTNIANKTLTTNFTAEYTVNSSNTSVATASITDGKLTVVPVAKGKTTITVTATKGSISVTKTFTVKVAAAVTDQLILFTNNYSWSSVYIYYQYSSNGTQTVGLTQMTKIGKNDMNQDVYGYNMPINHYNNLTLLIFASDTSWNNQTVDITSNLTTNSAYYISGDGTGAKARTVGTYDNPISVPQISADDIADLPINTSTSMTADLLNNVTPSSYTWARSSTSYLTLANASTTSNSNTLTGVYPGTTTITIRAYSPLPTNWTFETTDGAAALIAGTATATVTTTATPKSVTWGNKVSTDNGSTYVTTNASGAGTVTVSPTMTNGGTVAHGTSVKFTATTNNGYKFAGWQVNGTNSITSTTTKTVQITADTTVYALYYKTYTVTLTRKLDSNASTAPFKTTQYRNAASGSYSTYSSALTVNAGSPVYFKVSYNNGYQYSSVTNATVETANTVFKIAAVSANTTVTLTATKTNYNLTGQVSPTGHGSVKFYSNSACTTEITTAQINDTIYAKYIPSDDYVLKTFTVSGTGASAGTKNGNVQTITMGYGNLTVTANVILEYSVTYYVDMHSSSVTSLSAAVVTTSGGGTIQTDSSGAQCTANLSKQGDSSVYAATINTPVTQSGSTYNPVYLKITYNGTSYVNTLISANVQTLAGSTNKEVWLEAANESAVEKRVAYATNTTTSVTSGNKRIYVAKPYDWQTSETAWENIGLYHWGDYDDMGWANAYAMHYIGHDSDYHYYYYDIPTEAKYIIFQGWGSNTSFNLQAQTEDIELSTNYYVLSHDGAYKGTAGDNVSVPAYTRYATSATLNKGDTASIAPTTSNTVKYVTSNSSVATVSNSETTAGTVTAEGRGTATITVKVLGTIGSRVYSNNNSNPDMMTYTTSVTVKDPSHFGGFNIMSLESNTSTITIPTVGSTQPGYFDDIAVTVSGLANNGTYTNSAIVTTPNNGTWTGTIDGESVTKDVTYIVKYAKANSTFSGYSAISVTADVVSKSIRYDGANRYGYSEWTITPSGDTVPTATTKVDGGIETATTKGITLLGKTYSEVFEVYSYVDVTFTFNYYTYKTKRTVFKLDDEGNKIPKRDSEGAIIEGEYETEEKEFYQYDADYIDPDNHGVAGYSTANDAENRNSSNFDINKHELATYRVTDFEVRGKTSANITAADLYNYTYNSKTVTPALNAIADMPDNDYYSYRLNASTIKTPTANGAYKANVTVELLHAPKKYVVKLNGSNVTNGNDGSRNEGTNYYFYQEYATLSSSNSMNWCVSNEEGTSEGTPLATGKSYKFRVAGNTYIKSVAASIADADFNRSKVTNAGQQITHEAKSSTNPTIVEKLTNNFYISDFFVPEFVKNERDVQEDDVKFVGGGVVYYQVKDGVVDSKVEDAGYADSSGVGVKSSIADFIQEKIEEASVPAEIQGDDLRNEIAYGTEIAATADSTTGLRYRYLPYNVFTRDNGTLSTGLEDEVSGNVLIQQLGSNNVPVTRTVDGKTVPVYYTLATQTSSDTFRYSNTLRAYQYIYADKKENKATNAGKNMRLYAYYIYSYTDYDKDTGIPSTVYKVVLSNEYADASTYWNNTNTNN